MATPSEEDRATAVDSMQRKLGGYRPNVCSLSLVAMHSRRAATIKRPMNATLSYCSYCHVNGRR